MAGIENVTTWIGVAASAVSAAVTITTVFIRARTKRDLAAIEKGTPEAARIVKDAVTSFELPTQGLTTAQTFKLAEKEIAARDARHARVFYTSLALAVVGAVTTVVLAAISTPKGSGNTATVPGTGNIVIQGSPSATVGKD